MEIRVNENDAVDVRDATNMPRCGNGSGVDDATRRCVRRWRRWRRCDREGMGWIFFVVDVRRAFDGVDDDDDDGTGWMMVMMCPTVFFKLTRWFGCVCVCCV